MAADQLDSVHFMLIKTDLQQGTYNLLAGRPPSVGFCYGESHNSESAPASFDVCERVATAGSCYNNG